MEKKLEYKYGKGAEKLKIKIIITDGEKEVKSEINASEYILTKILKDSHGIDLITEIVDVLLQEIVVEK